MTKEELIIKHNEMVVKIIKECDYLMRNRYYLNDTAIKNVATRIKDITKFYIGDATWSDSKMTEEEKKAIEDIKKTIEFYNLKSEKVISVSIDNFDIDIFNTILNLIQKQQEELEKKDKMINRMAEELADQFLYYEPCYLDDVMRCEDYNDCKGCILDFIEDKYKGK